jgi:hypothetical protein
MTSGDGATCFRSIRKTFIGNTSPCDISYNMPHRAAALWLPGAVYFCFIHAEPNTLRAIKSFINFLIVS